MKNDRFASSPGVTEVPPILLRLPAVMRATGLARSTLYRMVAERAFPAPVKLAKRAVAWRHDDVTRWTDGLVPAAESFVGAERRTGREER